jgi:hypothetical protein
MGGIIMGALGGLGQGMMQVGQNMNAEAMQEKQAASQRDLVQMQSDLALQKEQAAAQFKADLELTTTNKARDQQVERINGAKQGIIQQALAGKYAAADDAAAGKTDAPLTAEQQAVVDGARGRDAQALLNDPDIATKAAISTGDIDPKSAATLTNSKEIAQLRQENFKDRTDAMVQMREIAAKAQVDAANIRAEAAQERARDGKVSASTVTMLVNSENQNIRAATSEMSMLTRERANLFGKDGEARKKDIDARLTELRNEIEESKNNKASYMDSKGIRPGARPASAASGTVPNPVAPGSAPSSDPLGLFPKKK